jgi:TolB-like protein/DNA-binding winged helix-turn-helix (wHTH) protein
MLYRFSDCTLDMARFQLCRQGRPVKAEPQVLRLLQLLIENRDRVVSRSEIHARLWGRRLVTDNALNVRMKSARRAVGDTGQAQSIIRTVQGAGYQFMADVDCSSQPSIRLAPYRAGDFGGAVVHAPAALVERALTGQPSIVVLPFESISADASETVIARGLAHDIITRIARSRTMLIIARGTAFKFPSGQQDVMAIGRKLGVRYVVQGAVQIASGRLKVSVALANALTCEEISSEQYTRKLDDFMLVQEEIADMVVSALEASVQREEMQRSLLMPSTNLDAWSAYHRGLHHMYRFKLKDCDKAERLFRRSIDLEPGVPRAYAGLSFVNFERAFMHFGGDRSAAIHKAFDYAQQSLSIDPMDPMGHWVLARAQLLRAELEASKRSLETAIDLNPSYAIAQYSLGWVALQLGEHELCSERIGLARRLSPYDPLKFAMLGVTALNLAMMGRTGEAVVLAKQSLRQPNAHYQANAFAAVTHALDGQTDRARELFAKVRQVVPAYDLADFLAVFPFRRDDDARCIRKAFDAMRPPGHSH